MKTIIFRPLRRIKKTGKITVASYMQWRKVKTADYSKFNLIIDDEYKRLPSDELVYDNKGENLFWRELDPEQLFARGLDCDGVPTFSHGTQKNITIGNMYRYTLEEVSEVLNPMKEYELLTVGIVVKWFGWFLYQLENNSLKIGK